MSDTIELICAAEALIICALSVYALWQGAVIHRLRSDLFARERWHESEIARRRRAGL